MKVVLLALGSRGDVQPMVSLGKALRSVGKPVMVVALREFAPLVEAAGLLFMPIDGTFEDTGPAAAETARKMAGGGMSYQRAVSAGLADIAPQVAVAEMAAVEPGDLVVGGVLSIDDAVALQEARGCLAVHVLTAPLLPTASGPSTVFAIRPQGKSILNRWAGRAILAMSAPMCTTTGSHLRNQLNLPRTRALGFVKMLQTVPTLLTTSPLVTPPPGDWLSNICQTGIWFDESPAWDPPADLSEFLTAGDPPVFIGFGSMPSADPSADVKLMTQAARQAGRRAVIRPSYGWCEPEDSPEDSPHDVYLLREAPYRWLFPQMGAIIHHGGAGTTAEALLAGVPNGVVAFGVDQPYHGRRIHELGAGPAPIKRSKLTADRLTELITTLTRPAQAAQWLTGATEARSHLLQERGLEVAAERLSMLMTNGDPFARGTSARE
ncbi:MAG TPA: glycosyltransferase [Dermatophilaceae bacterium]